MMNSVLIVGSHFRQGEYVLHVCYVTIPMVLSPHHYYFVYVCTYSICCILGECSCTNVPLNAQIIMTHSQF